MEPGDSPKDRRRSKRDESEINEREGMRERAMERERVYFEETATESETKEKVDP